MNSKKYDILIRLMSVILSIKVHLKIHEHLVTFYYLKQMCHEETCFISLYLLLITSFKKSYIISFSFLH